MLMNLCILNNKISYSFIQTNLFIIKTAHEMQNYSFVYNLKKLEKLNFITYMQSFSFAKFIK
jgi:hypothetical protein